MIGAKRTLSLVLATDVTLCNGYRMLNFVFLGQEGVWGAMGGHWGLGVLGDVEDWGKGKGFGEG